MKNEYDEETYLIPENFAQEGYVRSFKIVNVIEACLIGVAFAILFYYLPIKEMVNKIALYICVAGLPILISLNGISGDCLSKTILNWVRNKKKAKIYGPPSEAYKREFNKKQIENQFKQSATINKKEVKKHGKKERK